MSDWVDVCSINDVAENKPLCTIADGTKIVLFKLEGRYYAIENICTHDGGELSGGCVEHDQIICPRHGARFSIKTGEALSAPAYEPVSTFQVRLVGDKLQVHDDRFD